jgi:ribosomal protein S17
MKGVVVSNKMEKALVVAVYTTKTHKKYNKQYKSRKKYLARCSDSSKFVKGQEVEINPTRPLSKNIKMIVVES